MSNSSAVGSYCRSITAKRRSASENGAARSDLSAAVGALVLALTGLTIPVLHAEEAAKSAARLPATATLSADDIKGVARSANAADIAHGSAGVVPRGDERWDMIRSSLLSEREVDSEERVVLLEIEGRAFDGARVPVTVHQARGGGTNVARLHLIVDNNPVPVAASFDFEEGVDWNSIDTELRINEYSTVRAVAELDDGTIDMSSSFVKAVGGCSAPPSSYDRSDATQLGNFRGGLDDILNPKRAVTARIRLIHPNASGMQFDQFTRTYIPPHFVHTMEATFDDEPLFTLATNFSLSQDPVLGFDFKAPDDGVLRIRAIDSKAREFEQSWPLTTTTITR